MVSSCLPSLRILRRYFCISPIITDPLPSSSSLSGSTTDTWYWGLVQNVAVRQHPTTFTRSKKQCGAQYTEWSDVTVICRHHTISMLWGNTAYCVKLSGKDMSRYSKKIESAGLRKCAYRHYLSRKVMSQQQTFLRACPPLWQRTAGTDMVGTNCITVTLHIGGVERAWVWEGAPLPTRVEYGERQYQQVKRRPVRKQCVRKRYKASRLI